jgi:PmbA protein
VSGPAAAAPVTLAALESLAAQALECARRAGAAHAEACIESTRDFSVRVRGGAIETLKQSGSRGLGLRVIVGDAVGFVSSTDLRPEALEDLARHAVTLARFSTADPANALPAPEDLTDGTDGMSPEDLALFDPALLELSPDRRIEMALALERLTLAHDPRIRRTDQVGVSSHDGAVVIANTHGLVRGWSATAISLFSVALADDRDGKQQTGGYGVSKRALADLPPVEAVATEAGRRAVARIGARSVASARVPVVMHPDVAAAWLSAMYDAFTGAAVLKKASWLTGKLDQAVATPHVTIVDDGRMPRGVGTQPCDGEGVPTRRNVLVDRGRLAMFTYDTYTARRASTRSTGNAVRSYASVPGIGYHNLHIAAGDQMPASILARVDRGFYMDDQGSFGFNEVTGDYSFQARGFWIEKGQKAFPVDSVTVASNSLEMLKNVAAVGSDLTFDDQISSPTLLIAEMTVSGAGGG